MQFSYRTSKMRFWGRLRQWGGSWWCRKLSVTSSLWILCHRPRTFKSLHCRMPRALKGRRRSITHLSPNGSVLPGSNVQHRWCMDDIETIPNFAPACDTLLDTSLLDKELPFVITEIQNNLAPTEVSNCNINILYNRRQTNMSQMQSSFGLESNLSDVGLIWLFCYSVLSSASAFLSQILKPLPVWQVK